MNAAALEILKSMEPKDYIDMKKLYIGDLRRWQADSKENQDKWNLMTHEEKQRVADVWKAGKGLYLFESCVSGNPEYVFPLI